MLRLIPPTVVQLLILAFGKAAFLLVFILLFKSLSLGDAGLFSVAYTIAIILATVSECGLRGLLVREVARAHSSTTACRALLACAFQSRILTLFPYLIFGYLAGQVFLPPDSAAILFLLLAAAWLDSNAFVFRGVIRAFDFIILDATLATGARLLLLAMTTLLYRLELLTLANFALLFAIVSFVDIMTSLGFIARKAQVPLTLINNLRKTLLMVQRGLPFILLNLIGILYLRIGILTLGLFASNAALGDAAAFNLSAKIPEGVSFLPIALMNASIPFFARNSGSLSIIMPTLRKLELVVGSAGIMISVGLVAFAEELILLLGTPQYLPYKTVFQVYALTVFLTFLQYVYANLLICLDQEKLVARRYGIVLAVSVVANLILVWKFEALGAAIALLGCEMLAVAIDLRFLAKNSISLDSKLILRWSGLFIASVVAAWLANLIPYPFGLSIYWMAAGGFGLILLIKSDLSGRLRPAPLPPH